MSKSINPITGEIYKIPQNLCDRNNINNFLSKNPDDKVIVVQGLGFVGAVMSLVCANSFKKNYNVIGIDLARKDTYWKIKSLNNGIFPLVSSDPKIEEFFQISKRKNNFYATYDSYCYQKADVIIVDINLDVKKNKDFNGNLIDYDVDLNPFKKAIESIGKNCKEDVLILVETTVPPGTCEKIVFPTLKKIFQERKLDYEKLKIGHSYERVMPGPNYIDSIQNFYRVYSGINEQSANATEDFLRTIIKTDKYPLTRLANTNSTEMAKVLENSYRAMNISFAVEWSRFAEEANVNLFEVVDAIRMRPTHANLMYPGIGVGGYCLTKDPLLASWAKIKLFNSEEILFKSESGVQTNDKMPLYAFNYLVKNYPGSVSKKNVALLGVSYRSDVGDTRYSPVESFYNYLINQGCNVTVSDPYLKIWEEKKINIVSDFVKIIDENLDILVFTTQHTEYKNCSKLIDKIMSIKNLFILDTVGLLNEKEINIIKSKHELRIIGRGDIK